LNPEPSTLSLFELILIAVGLSMDCFAVAVGVCTCHRQSMKNILKMAFLFGFFQGLMPVIGWLVGESLKNQFTAVDHWVAFSLLAFIGGKMIIQSFNQETDKRMYDVKPALLFSLAIATSIDALITGLSFGVINVNIFHAAVIIFIITFVVTLIGAKLADRTRIIPSRWAERIGGAVLILIGIKIVLDHMGIW